MVCTSTSQELMLKGSSAPVGEEARDVRPLFSFPYLLVDQLPLVDMEGSKVNWPCSYYVQRYRFCIHRISRLEVCMLLR